MAIDATPESVTGNSYQTVDEIDEILAQRLYVTAWNNATPADKEAVAIWATRLMERGLDYEGGISSPNQALRLPRSGLIDEEGRAVAPHVIHLRFREAHAELCLFLLKRDRTEEPEILGQGMAKLDVGPISITVDEDQIIPVIPDSVLNLLGDWASLKDGSVGASQSTVKLERA